MRTFRHLTRLIPAAILLVSQPVQAKVTKAVLAASPADFRGGCPVLITFNGSITVDAPGSVQYVFTRSDGATDTNTKTLVFAAAGTKSVTDTWTLGAASGLPYFSGWEAIKTLGATPVTSNQAPFTLRCNPPLNSAIAAHGNTDWHIDTANEFLFGVDMAGSSTAANHAPDTWTKRHIHAGLTNTAKYYQDKTVTPAGEDADATNGIDAAMLFFYAGHGEPIRWDTLGDHAYQSNMALANVQDGAGVLRYYWQCSCEVFAHGPRVCSAGGMEYSCPASFSGSVDTEDMRSVFKRWGPALRSDLRMACGASTSAYCHEGNVNKVWHNYNVHGMSVADSFIDGLSGAGVVPLCITMGGSNIANTPLYDATFTNEPNTSGASHLHIMYPGGTQSRWNLTWAGVHIPELYVRYRAFPPGPPERLRALDLRAGRTAVASLRAFAGGRAQVRHEPDGGGVYLSSLQRPSASARVLERRAYVERARSLVRNLGWENNELAEPEVTPILTATMPVGGSAADIRQGQKGVIVTYRRQIEMEGRKIDVIGDGGLVRVSMSNNGAILHASRVWRDLKPAGARVPLKTAEQAHAEALKKLRNPEFYRLDQWRWGYKELAGNEKQDDLTVVFQFAFVPKDKKDQMQHPPQMVEVPGERQ